MARGSVTADLSRIHDAFIVPVSTAAAYANRAAPVKQVGLDLGVRYVLQAGATANGSRLRVNAQLADTATGAQRWTETFEGDVGDLFALEDQLTVRIGNSIGNQMVILAAGDGERRQGDANVGDLLLRTRAPSMQPRSLQSSQEQERLLRQVLTIEPGNVQATNVLAESLVLRYFNYQIADAKMRQQLLAEATALNDKARTMSPDASGPINTRALISVARGELPMAVSLFERNIALRPRSPNPCVALAAVVIGLAQAHLMLGDPAAAAAWAQREIDTGTGLSDGYATLVLAYAALGDGARMRAAAAQLQQRFPDLTASTVFGAGRVDVHVRLRAVEMMRRTRGRERRQPHQSGREARFA